MNGDPETNWGRAAQRGGTELQGGSDGSHRGRDAAAVAHLRRAATPFDAVEEPAVFDLYKRLGFRRQEIDRWLGRVAVVAAVLAHIRSDVTVDGGHRRRFAEMLGGEPPLMSP